MLLGFPAQAPSIALLAAQPHTQSQEVELEREKEDLRDLRIQRKTGAGTPDIDIFKLAASNKTAGTTLGTEVCGQRRL